MPSSLYPRVMINKTKTGHTEDVFLGNCKARQPVVRQPCMFATSPIGDVQKCQTYVACTLALRSSACLESIAQLIIHHTELAMPGGFPMSMCRIQLPLPSSTPITARNLTSFAHRAISLWRDKITVADIARKKP
jgi:hypothetical protein